MKKTELAKIDFKKNLQHCYEDIAPLLEQELEKLRATLIQLPSNANEPEIMVSFEKCVVALNELDEDENNEHSIDTVEREELCEILYEMGNIVGLDADDEYVDEWRDW